MTPQQLRQLTDEAIARGEAAHQAELARLAAEEVRKQRAAELLADSIIAQIPTKCEQQARNKRSHAVVFDMQWERDYTVNWNKPGVSRPKPSDLIGAGAIVWKFCVEAGFNPTIEYWHDGEGVKSGHNIVVHW